jgi:hypothetical protein
MEGFENVYFKDVPLVGHYFKLPLEIVDVGTEYSIQDSSNILFCFGFG